MNNNNELDETNLILKQSEKRFKDMMKTEVIYDRLSTLAITSYLPLFDRLSFEDLFQLLNGYSSFVGSEVPC